MLSSVVSDWVSAGSYTLTLSRNVVNVAWLTGGQQVSDVCRGLRCSCPPGNIATWVVWFVGVFLSVTLSRRFKMCYLVASSSGSCVSRLDVMPKNFPELSFRNCLGWTLLSANSAVFCCREAKSHIHFTRNPL